MKDVMQNRKERIALPDVLGNAACAADWVQFRRREILKIFTGRVFGNVPPRPRSVSYETVEEVPVYEGLGVRRRVILHFADVAGTKDAEALWYLPASASAEHPVPAVVALNFNGNAGTSFDEDIPLREGEERGKDARRWDFPQMLKAGFSVITAPRNDFFDDNENGRASSIYRLFHPAEELTPECRRYTSISGWAWGYSRLFELAETDPAIDRRNIWAHGLSRLGKTALWTGANDPRFAGIVSNCSGCCGAAISRDKHPKSEFYNNIIHFTWWFVNAFDSMLGHDEEQDFDWHWLCALTAPRPLLITSAREDLWADPFNEFRSAVAVGDVYRLFGAAGLPRHSKFPAFNLPLWGDRVGYYCRTGVHDTTAYDWELTAEFIRQNRN